MFDKSAEIDETAELYVGVAGGLGDLCVGQRGEFIGIAIAGC